MSEPTSLPPLVKPPLRHLAMELRALFEASSFVLRPPNIRNLPHGDGHPVMIVPGFGTDDRATAPLRKALEGLGYAAHGWGFGTNLGMRSTIRSGLTKRLEELHERFETPTSLIGWSLGGVFVREMARHQPQHVRQVFTLGSPISGHPDSNNMVTLFKLANRGRAAKTDVEGFLKRCTPPPVPCTAIYTRTDGIVSWSSSMERRAANTENVEVRGSHLGLVCNREVLQAIAIRLAKPLASPPT